MKIWLSGREVSPSLHHGVCLSHLCRTVVDRQTGSSRGGPPYQPGLPPARTAPLHSLVRTVLHPFKRKHQTSGPCSRQLPLADVPESLLSKRVCLLHRIRRVKHTDKESNRCGGLWRKVKSGEECSPQQLPLQGKDQKGQSSNPWDDRRCLICNPRGRECGLWPWTRGKGINLY